MTPGERCKSGFVTLVGRPNAGKSTLINAIVGQRVAITSDTPQTTRHRLRAIYDTDDVQIVFVDTPGLHKPHDALGEELNRSALKSLEDTDAVLCVIDASSPIGGGDRWVIEQLSRVSGKKVLCLTKADLATPQSVERQIEVARTLATWDDVIVTSAKDDFNIRAVTDALTAILPEGPRWFPRETKTDQSEEVLIAEFIREKILRLTHNEVPHAIGVMTDSIEHDRKRDFWTIFATIYVERDSQKGIIVGKGGSMIKKIGTRAREDLERLLGGHVHLDLKVKVKAKWRRDSAQIRRFGYGEGL